jgi:hypothetical protein
MMTECTGRAKKFSREPAIRKPGWRSRPDRRTGEKPRRIDKTLMELRFVLAPFPSHSDRTKLNQPVI